TELILSTFIRFWRTSAYLFVETTYFILPPLKRRYHDVDKFNRHPTLHELFHLMLDAAVHTPRLWLKAPLHVEKSSTRSLSRARREQQLRHAIMENRKFDYGAITSVRQLATSERYENYFQRQDVARFY